MALGGLTLIVFILVVLISVGTINVIRRSLAGVELSKVLDSKERRIKSIDDSLNKIYLKRLELPPRHSFHGTLNMYEEMFLREKELIEEQKATKELLELQEDLERQLGIEGD